MWLIVRLPCVLRRAAAKVVESPVYVSRPGPELSFDEFAACWSSRDDASLAANALQDFDGAPLTASGVPGEWSFSLGMDLLRYEHVQSLDEFLELSAQGMPAPERVPTGPYRGVVDAIFEDLLVSGEWPLAVPFAVRNRKLGDVERLVARMPAGFVSSFGRHEDSRLQLLGRALAFLNLTEQQKSHLTSIINALVRLWESSNPGEAFTVAQVARAASLPLSDVRTLGLLLHGEQWLHISDTTEGWKASFFDEAAQKLRRVSDLREYLRVRRELKLTYWDDDVPDGPASADEGAVASGASRPELEPAYRDALAEQGWYVPDEAKHSHRGGAADVFRCCRTDLIEAFLVGTSYGLDDPRLRAFASIERLALEPNLPALGALKVHRRHDNRTKGEIAALTNVKHPHLVPLLAYDRSEDPRWLVTPYYPFGPLESHVSEYRDRPLDAVRAMRPVIDAAAALHAAGYVHRDIKPGNIFVRQDAKLVLGDVGTTLHEEDERHTVPYKAIFSPSWAPDWVKGRRRAEWKPPVDVFMLCRTIYFLITGEKPESSQYQDPEWDPRLRLKDATAGQLLGELLVRNLVTREGEVWARDASQLLEQVDQYLALAGGDRIPALLASLIAPGTLSGIDSTMTLIPLHPPPRARSIVSPRRTPSRPES